MTGALRITFGGYQGPESVHTRGMKAFAAALRDLTGGGIEVELHSDVTRQGQTLGELLEQTEAGAYDACYTSSSYLAGRVPSLGLFDLLFAAPERDRTFALLDGALGERLAADVAERTGFAMLGIWDNGLRHISSIDRALHRPGIAPGCACARWSTRTTGAALPRLASRPGPSTSATCPKRSPAAPSTRRKTR